MFRRIPAATAAVFVLGALTVAVPASQAAASSGLTVATGQITGVSGQALPGLKVDLYAWPTDAQLKSVPQGKRVPWKLMDSTTTSSSGSYSLQAGQAALKAAAAGTGSANLVVYTAAGQSWFPYRIQSGAHPAYQPATVNVTSTAKPNCGTYTVDGHKIPYLFSGYFKERQRAAAWAVVGQGYIVRSSGTRGDTLTFKYTRGSSHTQSSSLGVGVSGYGFDAGFTSDGSKTSSASHAEPFGTWRRNSLFETQFNVEQYRAICYSLVNHRKHLHQHGKCPTRYKKSFFVYKCLWMLSSSSWATGTKVPHPSSAPRATHCAQFSHNTGFDSDFGTAVSWSKGYQVGAADGAKGVNLKANFGTKAQTGYDANALLSFHFARNGYMCGTNAGPATAAQLVQRRRRP
jgi:hypothetical protein